MIVYRISKCIYLNGNPATYGIGASIAGGRWNHKGTQIIYTTSSSSLALLETLVHTDGKRVPPGLCIATLKIPARSKKTIKVSQLLPGWSRNPSPVYLKRMGDQFCADGRYLVLKVPSAVNPAEFNYLINPLHKNFFAVTELKNRPLKMDKRLLKKK
jgi:RES domain-containing protein